MRKWTALVKWMIAASLFALVFTQFLRFGLVPSLQNAAVSQFLKDYRVAGAIVIRDGGGGTLRTQSRLRWSSEKKGAPKQRLRSAPTPDLLVVRDAWWDGWNKVRITTEMRSKQQVSTGVTYIFQLGFDGWELDSRRDKWAVPS